MALRAARGMRDVHLPASSRDVNAGLHVRRAAECLAAFGARVLVLRRFEHRPHAAPSPGGRESNTASTRVASVLRYNSSGVRQRSITESSSPHLSISSTAWSGAVANAARSAAPNSASLVSLMSAPP